MLQNSLYQRWGFMEKLKNRQLPYSGPAGFESLSFYEQSQVQSFQIWSVVSFLPNQRFQFSLQFFILLLEICNQSKTFIARYLINSLCK
jgi:hypothetical protein